MSAFADKAKCPAPSEENESEKNVNKADDDAFLNDNWLSSLSEPQLDMLVYLKRLVIKQIQDKGCYNLIEEFDVKMIRAIGSILHKYFKMRMQEVSSEDIKKAGQSKFISLKRKRADDEQSPV